MNAKEWADKFDGLSDVDRQLDMFAPGLKQDNMLVICGGSDDLIETYGAMRLEEGAIDGATYYLDRNGLHKYPSENRIRVNIYWCPKNDTSGEVIAAWLVDVGAIPHAMFKWIEEDEVYCWCAIICLDDLPNVSTNSTYEKGFKDGAHALLSYMQSENMDVMDIEYRYVDTENGALEESFFEELKKH
jgi:hypothetical protein